MVKTSSIALETQGHAHMVNITADVARAVQKSGVGTGIVTVFCPSATSSLTTIEFEDGAVQDFKRLFDEIIAPDREYLHNVRWGDGNGHSHVRAALLGPSLTIPFVDSKLTLGRWQEILYVDFDNRPRSRKLVVQILGE